MAIFLSGFLAGAGVGVFLGAYWLVTYPLAVAVLFPALLASSLLTEIWRQWPV